MPAAPGASRCEHARIRCDEIIPGARSGRMRPADRVGHQTKNCPTSSRASRSAPSSGRVYAVRNDDSALDIVQDAMIRLAEKYADRPAAELPLIFQRILSNATMDWFRREKVRNALHDQPVGLRVVGTRRRFRPAWRCCRPSRARSAPRAPPTPVSRAQILHLIDEQVAELPARQREAFLLRYWEEFDVAETAAVMGCSEGSVKTHCSRAVHALAKSLRAKGIATMRAIHATPLTNACASRRVWACAWPAA